MLVTDAITHPLVIFDCDGILVDSETLASRVFSEQLERIGLTYSAAECEAEFRGLSLASCQQRIEHKHQLSLPDNFFHNLQRATFERFSTSLQPVPGVIDVLDHLDNLGWSYCVASSGDYEKMHFTLGHTGILERFRDKLFSAVDVKKGKPEPDLFLHAARLMGYHNHQCIVIEDSSPGVQAAIAAGMRVCAYGTHLDVPSVQFDDMRQLPAILHALSCDIAS